MRLLLPHFFFFYFGAAAVVLSVLFTLAVRYAAVRWQVEDIPDLTRKRHVRPVPLLGGVGIFCSFWIIAGGAFWSGYLGPHIPFYKIAAVFTASLVLLLVGIYDDWRSSSPYTRLALTFLAVLITVFGGVTLATVTNPFGEPIGLGEWRIFSGINFSFGQLVVIVWLMFVMYTTKLLDGLDGLTTGIGAIGAIMILLLTMTVKFYQPGVGLLAFIFAAVLVGFLCFNFHPAKIFLGESGSLLVGYFLGVLAVISGSKIATTLLVIAVPMLDMLRVIVTRLIHKHPLFVGDREHLHFRLLDAGWSERATVLFLYAVALLFGVTTLFLQSTFKLVTLGFLALAMILVGVWLSRRPKV